MDVVAVIEYLEVLKRRLAFEKQTEKNERLQVKLSDAQIDVNALLASLRFYQEIYKEVKE